MLELKRAGLGDLAAGDLLLRASWRTTRPSCC